MRAAGAVVGSYELIDRIGVGGMGEVWKARDRLLDRLVALKFLSRQDARHDLLSEARAASSLNHPNIVTIFQVGESDGDTYLAMEFIEGESLRRYVTATGDVSEALDISGQIVDGLASAHARGIIHRDLKPENIMIRADGQVKLVDFGLAKRLFPSDATTAETAKPVSQSGELVGTYSYMSPEQARGHAITTSSDVFSLGIVMYELFSGRHPFRREEMLETLNAIVKHEPPPLAKERPDMPPGMGEIVSKSLKKEPSERYSSALEISEPLKNARHEWDRTVTSGPVIASRPATKRSRVIGAAALVVLLVLSGWSVFRPGSNLAGAEAPGIRSLAVMPFRGADQTATGLADTLSEDLGSALGRAGFQVASRTGVDQLGASADRKSAALELGVDSILEGSVRDQGGSLRVYVELVNARSGFQIWSGTFNGSKEGLVTGDSPMATEIVNQIRLVSGGKP